MTKYLWRWRCVVCAHTLGPNKPYRLWLSLWLIYYIKYQAIVRWRSPLQWLDSSFNLLFRINSILLLYYYCIVIYCLLLMVFLLSFPTHKQISESCHVAYQYDNNHICRVFLSIHLFSIHIYSGLWLRIECGYSIFFLFVLSDLAAIVAAGWTCQHASIIIIRIDDDVNI